MMGITNILFHNQLFPHEVEMMTLTKKYCVECSTIIIRFSNKFSLLEYIAIQIFTI